MERKDKHLSKRSLCPDRWFTFYTGVEDEPGAILGLPLVGYKGRILKNKASSRCRPPGWDRSDLISDASERDVRGESR